ncbi:MAG: hypothetical protein KatS3mg051_2154 [Anaerolineae bacterium]|nr:MAG: hypothetical protein KatS3mg051_2154 [Anaerolineae bacterium]
MNSYDVICQEHACAHPRVIARVRSRARAISIARDNVDRLQFRGGGEVYVLRVTGAEPAKVWWWLEHSEGGYGARMRPDGTYAAVRRPRFRA